MTGWKTRIHSFHTPPFLFLRHQGLTTKPGSPLNLQASRIPPPDIFFFLLQNKKKLLPNRLLFFIQGDCHTRRSHHRPRQDGTRAHFRSCHHRHHQCDALRRPWHCHDYRKRSVGKDVGTIKKRALGRNCGREIVLDGQNGGDDDGAAGFFNGQIGAFYSRLTLSCPEVLVGSAMMPPA